MECAVRAPERRAAAIPEDAHATAIFLSLLMWARIKLRTKVLPVPPGASMKKALSISIESRTDNLVVYATLIRYQPWLVPFNVGVQLFEIVVRLMQDV